MRLVAEYLDKIEDDNDRTQLLESVAKELKDLNISPNKLKKRGAALRKGPATPKRNLYPRAANGLAAMIGFPHPLEAFLPGEHK